MSYPIYTQPNLDDIGTNAPERTLEQTQQPTTTGVQGSQTTAVQYTNPFNINKDDDGNPLPATTQGRGSPGDDNPNQIPQPTQTTTVVNAASSLGNPITPQPNVLDQYASYTYSLSWYVLTPDQFTTMQKTSKIDTNAWSLLMQSGGAPVGANRNKYFNLDYYMDNLIISTSFNDNGPSSVTNLEFTVTEPNGITLLQNLNNALRDLFKQPTGSVAKVAPYCMVIRFYGYDKDGNLITKVAPPAGSPGTSTTSNAVVVKYIPFNITEFTFKAASRAVEYQIKGTPPAYKYAKGSALGSVPFPLELSGETVNDVLNGTEITDTGAGAEAGDRGANSTGSPSVQTGPQQPSTTLTEVQATQQKYGI